QPQRDVDDCKRGFIATFKRALKLAKHYTLELADAPGFLTLLKANTRHHGVFDQGPQIFASFGTTLRVARFARLKACCYWRPAIADRRILREFVAPRLTGAFALCAHVSPPSPFDAIFRSRDQRTRLHCRHG